MECKMQKLALIVLSFFFLFSCQKESSDAEKVQFLNSFDHASKSWKNATLSDSFINFINIVGVIEDGEINLDKEIMRTHLASLSYLGDISKRLGNKKDALKYHLACKNKAIYYNRADYQIIANYNLANLGVDENDSKSIIKKFLEESPPYNTKNPSIESPIIYMQALLNAKAGRFAQAKSTINELLEKPYKNIALSKVSHFNFYKGLGEICQLEKKIDLALKHFNDALNLSSDEDYNLLKAETYLLIAESYFSQGEFHKTDSVLQIAIPLAEEDILLRKQTQELYSKLYEKTEDTKNGLSTFYLLREIDNTLNAENNKIQGFIADKLEREADKKLHQARIKYISGIGILSLMLLSLLHFYKQAHNRRNRLELEVSKKRLEVKNKELEVRYKELELTAINKVIDAQEDKEKEFAEILHDNVGANLSALNMFLSTLQKDVPEQKYKHLTKVLGTTILNTRSLSHLLEPPTLKSEGLICAITEKAEELTFDGLNIEVNSPIEFVALEDNLSRSLYNTILEFMNNTMRHSEATKMQIDFDLTNNNFLAVKVADNGKGFDTNNIQQSKGLGLNSIRSRVNYFNGTFNIQSSNKGTIINITVPAKVLKQGA